MNDHPILSRFAPRAPLAGFALALLLPLLLACGSSPPADAAPAGETRAAQQADEPAEPAESEDAATADCAALGELACLAPNDCVLVAAGESGDGYVCRPAENDCERDFDQRNPDADACAAREGCTYDGGSCYCPPDVTCICGGGPPPRCHAAGDSGSAATS